MKAQRDWVQVPTCGTKMFIPRESSVYKTRPFIKDEDEAARGAISSVLLGEKGKNCLNVGAMIGPR
jgi:hypothetical protein